MRAPQPRQQPQGTGELPAGGAELVDEPGRSLGLRSRDHEGAALEVAQQIPGLYIGVGVLYGAWFFVVFAWLTRVSRELVL